MPSPVLVAASLVLALSNPVIVYIKQGGDSGFNEVMTSGRAGRNSVGIAQPESLGELSAALSPDGRRVAFVSEGVLWTAPLQMRSGGKAPSCNVRRQANGYWAGAVKVAARASGPLAWSPDSRSLLFVRPGSHGPGGTVTRLSITPTGSSVSEAQVMLGEGTGRDGNPSYSPDGQTVLFDRHIEGKGRRLFTVGADGRSPTEISKGEGDWTAGSWSPDGSKIAAVRLASEDSREPSGIYLMNRDGRDVRFVEGTGLGDERPFYSPEGDELLFIRRPPANSKGVRGVFVSGAADGRPPVRFRGIDEANALPLQWIGLK